MKNTFFALFAASALVASAATASDYPSYNRNLDRFGGSTVSGYEINKTTGSAAKEEKMDNKADKKSKHKGKHSKKAGEKPAAKAADTKHDAKDAKKAK